MNDFETFIWHEKRHYNLFLEKLQIFDRIFDKEEYLIIQSMWKDQTLIDNIYTIIDDILKKSDLDKNLRFLIIGDFLFSLTSFELTDPSELILKTTRDAYINRIHTRASINIFFEHGWKTYVTTHKKLLIGLTKHKILSKTKIRTWRKTEWITTIYFMLEIKEDFIDRNGFFGISKFPFVIRSINYATYSVGSFRNIWKTKRKKREMVDFALDYNGVKRANQIGFVLSKNLYNINKDAIESEKARLLENVKCNSIEEYFLKLKKKLKDYNYTNDLLRGKEKINNTEFRDIKKLNTEEKREYSILLNYFQKMLAMQILNQIKFDEKFYLPSFLDNRGRQYYSTIISPTFYVIFRNLYAFKEQKDFHNLEQSTFYKKILEYKHLVHEFKLNDKNSYIALVLLIEIGKFFIKNNQNSIIKTEEIIKKGLENYKQKNTNLEFKNVLYIQKIYNGLDNLINYGILDINTIIFKDATASGIQNFGILLGYQKEKLIYLNLQGNDWCDTYQYLINKFLNENWIKKRKYWKNTLMTIPYNAEWFSCFGKFLEALRKDGIEYWELDEIKKNELKKIHQEFYNKIKKELKNEFYLKEQGDLIKFKYNKWIIVNKKEYKINYENNRDKYTDVLYMLIHDEEATKTALEANNMHYLDALLVKEIIKKFEIITIHDCFGIRLCELHLVMDEINKYYSKKIGMPTYCIHIII